MTIMIMSFVLTRIWARCVVSVMPSDYNVLSFTLAKPGTFLEAESSKKAGMPYTPGNREVYYVLTGYSLLRIKQHVEIRHFCIFVSTTAKPGQAAVGTQDLRCMWSSRHWLVGMPRKFCRRQMMVNG